MAAAREPPEDIDAPLSRKLLASLCGKSAFGKGIIGHLSMLCDCLARLHERLAKEREQRLAEKVVMLCPEYSTGDLLEDLCGEEDTFISSALEYFASLCDGLEDEHDRFAKQHMHRLQEEAVALRKDNAELASQHQGLAQTFEQVGKERERRLERLRQENAALLALKDDLFKKTASGRIAQLQHGGPSLQEEHLEGLQVPADATALGGAVDAEAILPREVPPPGDSPGDSFQSSAPAPVQPFDELFDKASTKEDMVGTVEVDMVDAELASTSLGEDASLGEQAPVKEVEADDAVPMGLTYWMPRLTEEVASSIIEPEDSALPKSPDGEEFDFMESLGLRESPSLRSPVVAWIRLERLFLGRLFKSGDGAPWLEVILDGSPPLFILKSVWGLTFTCMKHGSSEFGSAELQISVMAPVEIDAVWALHDLAFNGVRQEDELSNMIRSGALQTSKDQAWYWRVVSKLVWIRDAPSLLAPKVFSLRQGGLLLASPLPSNKAGVTFGATATPSPGASPWVKVIPEGAVDKPSKKLFALADGSSQPCVPPVGVLLEPVLSLRALLCHGGARLLDDELIFYEADIKGIATSALASLDKYKNSGTEPDSNPIITHVPETKQTQQMTFKLCCDFKGEDEWYVVRCRAHTSEYGIQLATSRFAWKLRYLTAHKLFSQHDLSFPLLRQGPGWYLQEYEGEKVNAPTTHAKKLALAKELGHWLREAHAKLPTAWFDDWRELLREHHPWLRHAGIGSHAWRHACILGSFKDCSEKDLIDWVDRSSELFAPLTAVSRRIVTCHCDVRHANMLRSSEGKLLWSDVEQACVTYAIEDIACALRRCFPKARGEEHERFLAAYIGSESISDADIDDLLFDAMCWNLSSEMLRTFVDSGRSDDSSGMAAKLNLVRTAKSSTPEGDQLRGILVREGWSAAMEFNSSFR
mmetsp:Transcript_27836/g.62908  ORF Transcript_27836/g.62908 Transcript_27836/m.62908 type:complete len:927 (+) Transcript_27836:60-2840(+)